MTGCQHESHRLMKTVVAILLMRELDEENLNMIERSSRLSHLRSRQR